MSNVAHLAERAVALADTKPAASTETKQLFMMLHGMYGNLFVSKFATGELNDNGKDKGILSAMKVWEATLKKYSRDDNSIIEVAVEACKTKHVEYPPSLPQFVALCEAELSSMPRPTFFEQCGTGRVLVGVDAKFMQERRKRIAEEHIAKAKQAKAKQATGLDQLKQLIAQAKALAGADEAAELLKMDRA